MDFQTPWIKYGIIYGLISTVVLMISAYLFKIGIWTQFLISIVTMLTLFFLASKDQKSQNSGYLPYGEALKVTFLTGFTGSFLYGLITIIMIFLIDPDMRDFMIQLNLEFGESMMRFFGMSEEIIEKSMEEAEEGIEDQFTPLGLILNIFKASVLTLFFAAIFSIFVKKNENIHDIKL